MKANEFDKKIKDQLRKVEQTRPSDVVWDINKSWDKLALLLKQASPKSIVWYFSLAASVSMVMANVSLFTYDWSRPEIQEQEKLAINTSFKPKAQYAESKQIDATTSSPHQLLSVNSKGADDIPAINHGNVPKFIPQATVYRNGKMRNQSFAPRLNTGMGPSGVKLSGELIFISHKNIKNVNLGMSLEMNSHFFTSQNKETGISNRSQHAVYMNMVVINDNAKRPWSARIGTPIWQTNGADSSASMLKMNYQTKVGRKLHIGPELIFTKGFKQVYPGISLSFG